MKATRGFELEIKQMEQTNDYYQNNPLIHRERRLGLSNSEWVRSFACVV